MRALLDALRSASRRDWIAFAIEIGAIGLLFSGAYAASQLGALVIVVVDGAVLP